MARGDNDDDDDDDNDDDNHVTQTIHPCDHKPL
jgi:hypothetical protein